ncbi:MAG TPA: hypothetical protein VGL59_25925, partial [Polyangia bacterium]
MNAPRSAAPAAMAARPSVFARRLRSRLGDGALMVSCGAATLLVLIIIATLLTDVVRHGTA